MHAACTRKVGAYAAKAHLLALLQEIAAGHEIIITKRDRPIAKLVPMVPSKVDLSVFDEIRAWHGTIKLPDGETVKDLIMEGRRTLVHSGLGSRILQKFH